jgi:hypothetical protein
MEGTRKKEYLIVAKTILDAAKRFLDAAVWIAKETYLPDKKTKNPNCLSNSDS